MDALAVVVVRGWGGWGLCPIPNPTLPLPSGMEHQTRCQIMGGDTSWVSPKGAKRRCLGPDPALGMPNPTPPAQHSSCGQGHKPLPPAHGAKPSAEAGPAAPRRCMSEGPHPALVPGVAALSVAGSRGAREHTGGEVPRFPEHRTATSCQLAVTPSSCARVRTCVRWRAKPCPPFPLFPTAFFIPLSLRNDIFSFFCSFSSLPR